MSSTILQVENLSLASVNGDIINNISFQIHRGEIVALTGKSGGGKTSIALAILDLLPEGIQYLGGIIRWNGNNNESLTYPDDKAEWHILRGTQIGFIQQDVYGIFDPVMKMGQQMMLIIREKSVHPISNLTSVLKSKMTEVGINDADRIWNSYPHQLSGGQLQRCQICVCIVMQPRLIIADEPTSAIDKINQLEILDVLARLREKYHIAILCISHEESVVSYLADREIQIENFIETEFTHRDTLINEDEGSDLSILEVINLGFEHRYGGLIDKKGAHVKDISFSLSGGKCLGIIGESGSGKSTLASMLAGLHVPSEGIVKLDNADINFLQHDDIRRLRSKIQLVMQDGRGSLHPGKTIKTLFREVVIHRGLKDEEILIKTEQVLSEVGLPAHVLNRKADQLSGGECLRISIARALLLEPEILICDESTSALDSHTRDGIIKLLKFLMMSRNLGMIVISHDGEMIRTIANDILVMSGGQIIESGSAEDIFIRPVHETTKRIFSTQATLAKKRTL